MTTLKGKLSEKEDVVAKQSAEIEALTNSNEALTKRVKELELKDKPKGFEDVFRS